MLVMDLGTATARATSTASAATSVAGTPPTAGDREHQLRTGQQISRPGNQTAEKINTTSTKPNISPEVYHDFNYKTISLFEPTYVPIAATVLAIAATISAAVSITFSVTISFATSVVNAQEDDERHDLLNSRTKLRSLRIW